MTIELEQLPKLVTSAGLTGDLLELEPLAKHTSWRVGGPARYFYRPKSIEDLQKFISLVPKSEPILWLGLGSNLLIRDGGINGVVIATQGRLMQLSQVSDNVIRAEAGLSCAKVARYGARLSLQGIEFLAGVPGTIGGALAMNAGCFGGETWDWIEKVETIDRDGVIRERGPEDYKIAYRSITGPEGEGFLAGYFKLNPGSKEIALENIRSLLDRRAATQPTGDPSGGSVFKNPEQDHSARLIEQSGLKGFSLGGAIVSNKHANFIVHNGDATAADIEQLISHVAETVEEKFGVRLIPEVKVLGRNSS